VVVSKMAIGKFLPVDIDGWLHHTQISTGGFIPLMIFEIDFNPFAQVNDGSLYLLTVIIDYNLWSKLKTTFVRTIKIDNISLS
jgi:hypothetical protein